MEGIFELPMDKWNDCRGVFLSRGCEGNVIDEGLIVLLYSTRWHCNARRWTGFQIIRMRSRSWREDHMTI